MLARMCGHHRRRMLGLSRWDRKARTMIDWDSDDWGNRVTFAADGSWVADKHGNDAEQD
jgi:hypothetical protein